jgi:endonuclease YncB( thermonuclease family)
MNYLPFDLLSKAETIERFTLYGIETFGKVVSIYDGDTFDLSFLIPLEVLTTPRSISKKNKGICCACDGNPSQNILMRMKCRLDGIDARELKTEKGQKAKEILQSFIENRILKVKLLGNDKYGRLLVNVFVGSETGNEFLLNEHLKTFKDYFCFYDGGQKTFSGDE